MAESMDAGHELDLRVLTEVMGGAIHEGTAMHPSETGSWWCHTGGPEITGHSRHSRIGPIRKSPETALYDAGCSFSRDDAAAMRVVDEMVRRGFKFIFYQYIASDTGKETCLAQFQKGRGRGIGEARHPDRRVAICLASLAAVPPDAQREEGA